MRVRIVKVAALLAVPAMLAWTHVNTPLRLQPTSKLWVNGTSTIKSFECQAKTFAVAVESAVPNAIAAVLAGEHGVGAVELTVPVAELDCRNGTMNEHMLKAMKATEHKNVVFTLNSYDLAKAAEGTRVSLRGTLALGGVQKDVLIDADVKAGPEGALIVAGKHALKMTEYGLKPPKLMLGTLKVNELVNVSFELLLKQ